MSAGLKRLIGLAVLFVVLFLIPLRYQSLRLDAALAVIFGFAILSLVLLTGYVGQVSLCQATFMGVAAYGTGMLTATFHLNYWVAAVAGVLMAFLLGVAVGLPALRLRGILLAIVTLGVALVFDKYFFRDDAFTWFTNGSEGWRIDATRIGGLVLDGRDHLMPLYLLMLVSFFAIAILLVNIHNSGSGRRFRAIRDSELAAATMGVDLTRYKLFAFGLSAAIAGIGGAFYPLLIGSVSADPFSVFYSLQFAAFAVLMGIRYVPAAALAGFFMAFTPAFIDKLNEGYRHFVPNGEIRGEWFGVVLGALLVVQLIALPDGVWGDLRHLPERTRKLREAVAPKPRLGIAS